jgi:hypothetical protein
MRDIDIRRALRLEMKRRHGKDPNTLLIEELGLCQGIARVDFAVVNGSIHGYEIKSARDTLARLPAQLEVYNRALEFITIVAAENHLSAIKQVVPAWWGLRTVVEYQGDLALKTLREAKKNLDINPLALAQLLWRSEALQILIDHDQAARLRSKARAELWNRLAVAFSVDELGKIVRECLKRRGDAWRSLESRA